MSLDQVADADADYEEARASKGYALTHVGKYRKQNISKDGLPKLFNLKKAKEALGILDLVFTFARGSRCPCLLPYGYRHMPTEVCRWVETKLIDPADYYESWFSEHAPSRCFAFADSLYKMHADQGMRKSIETAIYVYAEANANRS